MTIVAVREGVASSQPALECNCCQRTSKVFPSILAVLRQWKCETGLTAGAS